MYEKLQLFFSRTLTIAQTWVADKKNPTGSEQRKKSGARGKKGTILLDGCAQGDDHFELQLDFETLSSTDRVRACEGRKRESYSHTSIEWEGTWGREDRRGRDERDWSGGNALCKEAFWKCVCVFVPFVND